jgi:hypothetical protein
LATFAVAGDTVTARSTAGRTVTAAVPERRAAVSVAVIVATPVPFAVSRPCEPDALDTVTTAVLEDDQVTSLVRFAVDPSR